MFQNRLKNYSNSEGFDFGYFRMKKFLISLPENTIFEEYEAIELTHPKGKTVTFLHRNGEFFELHHFEHRSGAHSCFTECDEKNTGY